MQESNGDSENNIERFGRISSLISGREESDAKCRMQNAKCKSAKCKSKNEKCHNSNMIK